MTERDRLLSRASLRMAPLQDAIDLGSATQEEVASLNQWKQYRVDLNRIEQQETFPKRVKW
ncbi:tail fiber assembly protein, partial [Klebsiella pneumoniae]|uniref:tail fiber assembly protein n=1 Tax=Klebsiella pneumoniae TaxID=573 RepID=UPI0027302EEF